MNIVDDPTLVIFQGGVYILQILDYYVAAWSLLFIGLAEVMAVTYVYGQCRLRFQLLQYLYIIYLIMNLLVLISVSLSFF